jgi:hypothetical protein
MDQVNYEILTYLLTLQLNISGYSREIYSHSRLIEVLFCSVKWSSSGYSWPISGLILHERFAKLAASFCCLLLCLFFDPEKRGDTLPRKPHTSA